MRFVLAISFLSIILLFTTCKKQDSCPEPPTKHSTCELVQSILLYTYDNENEETFPQYREEYDGSGRVSKVVAGVFVLAISDSIPMVLKYSSNTIYFLAEQNQSDTIMTAFFGLNNQLQKIVANDQFPEPTDFYTTDFNYDGNGRLKSFISHYNSHEPGNTTQLNYDANGNVVHMGDDDSTGMFYTYDLSVRSKKQFYSDDFTKDAYNTFYLAEFLGWLPDLMPVNKRLTAKEVVPSDSGDTELVNNTLSNHVYDAEGNLLSYEIFGFKYLNVWNCDAKKRNGPN